MVPARHLVSVRRPDRRLDLVEKARLSADVRDTLALRTPEDRIPASRRLDGAMARSTRLAVVPDDLRDALIAAGLRVWTVGYHRIPGWFRLIGVGGPGEPAWIEQHGPDDLDRILRAASDGVLDEASILLAELLARERWRPRRGRALIEGSRRPAV